MNDIIKMYQQSIRCLESVVLEKKATIRMLAFKYEPKGLWDHGEELVALETEVAKLDARLTNQKCSLKKAKVEAFQTRGFLAGEEDQLF